MLNLDLIFVVIFQEPGRLLLIKSNCVSLITEILESRDNFTQETVDPLTKEMADLVVVLTSGGMQDKVFHLIP